MSTFIHGNGALKKGVAKRIGPYRPCFLVVVVVVGGGGVGVGVGVGAGVGVVGVVVVVAVIVVVVVVAVVVAVVVVGTTACQDLWVCKCFKVCIKTKENAPRLHEVPVYKKCTCRPGQTTLLKTYAPCRRNTHVCMSLVATCSKCCCDLLAVTTSC